MRLHTPRVTGSFEVSSSVLTVNSSGTISASATSTGSFGAIRAAGMTVPNLLDFSSSIASRITTEESDFTAAGISGSWQGVIGSGSLGMVSGSEISTGSFGSLVVSDKVQGDLTIRDSLTVNKGLTVNDNQEAAYDFKVKSQNKSHTLYADSNKDKVGIGFSSPGGSDL